MVSISSTIWPVLALPGLCLWAIILLLPWRPWSTRESLDAIPSGTPASDLSRLTALIPARNEADVIGRTLQDLSAQGEGLKIILVDDQSTDQTGRVAASAGIQNLEVVRGAPLPDGWCGKLWALEQGRRRVSTELVLLLDADIRLLPGTVPALLRKLDQERCDLVSLMAQLRMHNRWERMLIPAFVFFFKLLYPFHLANGRGRWVAAAAGGCILVRTSALEHCGAFATLKNALIDDCTLARRIKDAGGRTWLGLTHSAISQRGYPRYTDIADMVARSAYSQLRYSPLLLGVCTMLMLAAFPLPLASALALEPAGLLALALMILCYLPVLRYYNVPRLWGLLLPVAGLLFMAMTWISAWRHWRKKGALWKNRTYQIDA